MDVHSLQEKYFYYKYFFHPISECIDWAVNCLERNQDNGDIDISCLAGAVNETEAEEHCLNIIKSYSPNSEFDKELFLGKYICQLHKEFYLKSFDILALELKLWRLFYDFDEPDWLFMLCRNCEYSTDMPVFEIPFQNEFEYIVQLWKEVKSSKEFNSRYDPKISETNDIS
ncbi:hypothetical protein [Desulfopila sp. IMCC35008]|uniref:hypothetical protein n=1 Tax=Desulfopila sp. IMCC35008 TaxID=2653858 RepID=UPI0013D10E1A|nr:hypothetical protein [Desulfopila sp. IMCC35008]